MDLPLHARENLLNLGFNYGVVIAQDVSVRLIGAVEFVFNRVGGIFDFRESIPRM